MHQKAFFVSAYDQIRFRHTELFVLLLPFLEDGWASRICRDTGSVSLSGFTDLWVFSWERGKADTKRTAYKPSNDPTQRSRPVEVNLVLLRVHGEIHILIEASCSDIYGCL